MIKKCFDRVNNVYLFRLHSKLGQIITWGVSENSTGREYIGIIYQINDYYYSRQVGRQQFPRKFWVYSCPSGMGINKTRIGAITSMRLSQN